MTGFALQVGDIRIDGVRIVGQLWPPILFPRLRRGPDVRIRLVVASSWGRAEEIIERLSVTRSSSE